jgi:hypothetical protein
MKLISEKYKALKPEIDYLSDEVVIAQAWKKTHGYIRTFNWYADTLALDVSALTIEENAKKWAGQLKLDYTLNELELVPAAKSEAWVLDNAGWHPKNEREEGKTPLRPLAHLTIRDQTWASAAMLCLANAVETTQGDCSTKPQDFEQARQNKVYSYGNRLVCDWKEGKAWFRWGNSETYRKFFTDYQNFLKRPLELGRLVSDQSLGAEDVYIVNLDLAKFYNTIDIEKLIERLKKISLDFGHNQCDEFWEAFRRITDWKSHWKQSDIDLAKALDLGDIKTGLPQGLVSSGFFANAYLADFDHEVGKLIGEESHLSEGLVIHDYCRYVDDIRLVVSANDISPQEIASEIYQLVSELLLKYGGEKLKLHDKKTKVTHLSDLDNSGSMANRIEHIQGELSGPADRDVLDSTMGVLENILTIEEQPSLELDKSHADIALLEVSSYDHDIRPDTLKRFAANRLENIIRSKRLIAHSEPLGSDKHTSNFEDSSELLAKKLISAWLKDPSLGLVLRKAIEIYPDADLFEPVFNAIFERSSFSHSGTKETNVTDVMMDYLLADLFRCASDFNGYFQVITYPESLTPTSVIELITRFAQKVLGSEQTSLFVVRQALMLLAVTNKPVRMDGKYEALPMQEALHSILVNTPPEYQAQRSALFEVAGQITGQFDTYASLFLEHITPLNEDERYEALEVFAMRGGPFWLSLWKQLKKKAEFKPVEKRLKWASPIVSVQPKPGKKLLSKVISSDINGFEFEHSLIKLACGLIALYKRSPSVVSKSPNQLFVEALPMVDWDKLWEHEVDEIICKVATINRTKDPRFEIPSWIDNSSDDNAALYWVGTILRASVLGGADFTGHQWKEGKSITYKGIRTSWYKRRMGMMHSPESILGEFATVSNWFSEILMRCLQWPGFESSHVKNEDIQNITDIGSFIRCLKRRLSYLNSIRCVSSNLPTLPTKVMRRGNKKNFRVVTVQQLLPRTSDFNLSDVMLNAPRIRAKHREHLLAVCQLTVTTLETKLNTEADDQKPFADLIVFPEVSVHINDQDVIQRLADKTQAIIFAGLVFTNHRGKVVNIARWFIPDYRDSGRHWIIRDQGKENMTDGEKYMGITSYRPCQHIIEVHGHPEGPFNLSGTICYDATDIRLAADLRNLTDLFVVVAHNKDVNTFDNMASALHYHMYQHVVISNIGEFGGSTMQAPYSLPYDRLISHVHGVGQIAINTADLDLAAFKRKTSTYKPVKTKPAGVVLP